MVFRGGNYSDIAILFEDDVTVGLLIFSVENKKMAPIDSLALRQHKK